MVIDDVGTIKNLVALQDLVVNGGKKRRKSKIIVTCQNWQILENHVNEVGKANVDLLKKKEAKKTFHVPCIWC